MSEVKRPRVVRRSFTGTIGPFGAVVLFVVSVFGAGISSTSQVGSSASPSASASVTQSSTPSQEPAPSHTALPTPSSTTLTPVPISTPSERPTLTGLPSRLVYDAVGIDLPVAPLDQEQGPFVPPIEVGMSYWLTHRPGYILAHSAQLEKWPFNALSAARIGDLIDVTTPAGVVQCKVNNVASYPKHDLEVDGKTPVWDIDDHLLRLIGCKDGDVWEQATVVTARCGN